MSQSLNFTWLIYCAIRVAWHLRRLLFSTFSQPRAVSVISDCDPYDLVHVVRSHLDGESREHGEKMPKCSTWKSSAAQRRSNMLKFTSRIRVQRNNGVHSMELLLISVMQHQKKQRQKKKNISLECRKEWKGVKNLEQIRKLLPFESSVLWFRRIVDAEQTSSVDDGGNKTNKNWFHNVLLTFSSNESA